MNKIREKIFLSTIFLLMLGFFVNFSGIWNPFKKESWELLVGGVKKTEETIKEVNVALGQVREILESPEPRIKGWTVRPTANTKLHEFMWVSTHNSFSSSAHKYGVYRSKNMSRDKKFGCGGWI